MDRARALTMRIDLGFSLLAVVTAGILLIWTGSTRADIYSWKDADGVIHFSNYSPPVEAEFYMVEQVSAEGSPSEGQNQEKEAKADPLKSQLDAANRKLEEALDKVDDLTQKVEQTRREASDAAEAARRAAAEAQAAKEAKSEETVVFGLPYRPIHHPPRPTPYYWQLDTDKYPYYHGPPGHHQHKGAHRPSPPPAPVKTRHANSSRPVAATSGGTATQR